MRLATGLAGLAILAAACSTQPAKAPDGSPAEAAELAVVVERGCMAYALGEKPVDQAMADAGLVRERFTFSWPSPGVTEPQYRSGAPGQPIVTIYGAGCTVRVRGADAGAFDRALDAVYARRFGAGFAQNPLAQPSDAQFPGMRRYCIGAHVFQSYPDPPGHAGSVGFNVQVSPGAPLCGPRGH